MHHGSDKFDLRCLLHVSLEILANTIGQQVLLGSIQALMKLPELGEDTPIEVEVERGYRFHHPSTRQTDQSPVDRLVPDQQSDCCEKEDESSSRCNEGPARESPCVLQDILVIHLANFYLRCSHFLDFCWIQASNQLLGMRLRSHLWVAHHLIEGIAHLELE